MAYKDIVPVGTALIVGATSFGLGVVYASLPYDYYTLWDFSYPDAFETSLAHYTRWANVPQRIYHILHFVIGLGLIGCFIKLYKPVEDAKYFEYGTLGLMMVAIIIYLTNLRVGINSALSGEWGDVNMQTGINVMAASQVMIVLVLVGVLVLQGGLYYAHLVDAKAAEKFYRELAEEEAAAAAAAAAGTTTEEPEATATGASTATTAEKPKKKKTKKVN